MLLRAGTPPCALSGLEVIVVGSLPCVGILMYPTAGQLLGYLERESSKRMGKRVMGITSEAAASGWRLDAPCNFSMTLACNEPPEAGCEGGVRGVANEKGDGKALVTIELDAHMAAASSAVLLLFLPSTACVTLASGDKCRVDSRTVASSKGWRSLTTMCTIDWGDCDGCSRIRCTAKLIPSRSRRSEHMVPSFPTSILRIAVKSCFEMFRRHVTIGISFCHMEAHCVLTAHGCLSLGARVNVPCLAQMCHQSTRHSLLLELAARSQRITRLNRTHEQFLNGCVAASPAVSVPIKGTRNQQKQELELACDLCAAKPGTILFKES